MKNLVSIFLFVYCTNLYAQKLEIAQVIRLSEMKEEDERDSFLQKNNFIYNGQETYKNSSCYAIQSYLSKQRRVNIFLYSIWKKDRYEHSFSVEYNTPDLLEKQKIMEEIKKLGYKDDGEFMGKMYSKNKSKITISTQSETAKNGKPFKNYSVSVSITQ